MYLGNIGPVGNPRQAGAIHNPQAGIDEKAVDTFADNLARTLFPLPVAIAVQQSPALMSKMELAEEIRHLAAAQKAGLPLANTKHFPGPQPDERCLMATSKGVAYQNAAEWKAGRGGLYISDDLSKGIVCTEALHEEPLMREALTRMRDKASFGAVTATAEPLIAPAATGPKKIADMSIQELERETRVLSAEKWENFPDAALKPSRGGRTLLATRNGVAYQNRREWNEGSGLYIPRDPARDIQCGDIEKKPRLLRETLAILRSASNIEVPSPEQQKLESAADKLIGQTTIKRERLFGTALSAPGIQHLALNINVMQSGDMYLKMDRSLNRIDDIHPKTEKRFIDLGKSIVAASVRPALDLGPRQHFKVVPNQFIAEDDRKLGAALNYTTIFTASETIKGKEIQPEDKAPPELSDALKTAGFLLQFNDLLSQQGKKMKLHNVVVEPGSGKMKAFDYFSDSPNIMKKPKNTSISQTLGKSRAEVMEMIARGESRARDFFTKNDESLRNDAQFNEKTEAVMAGIDTYIETCRHNLAQMED